MRSRAANPSTAIPRNGIAFALIALLVMLAAIAPGAHAVAATVNLAQSNQSVAPAPADAHRLATYFSPPYQAGPLPSVVEEILMRNAPRDLHPACSATVDSWGPAARGSSRLSLWILGVAGGNAWLTYRCDSRSPQFEGVYTERLAVFNSARATIQFLGLKASEDTVGTLYHVGLATMLKLRSAKRSAAFVIFAVDSSSAADSASRNAGDPAAQHRSAQVRQAENRYVVIANSATATKLVLVLVTARQRPVAYAAGDNASGSDEYRSALRFEHDLSGHLTGVAAYYREASLGARARFGVIRYEWNPATFTFAIAKPIPPPLRHQPVRLPPVPGYHPLAN